MWVRMLKNMPCQQNRQTLYWSKKDFNHLPNFREFVHRLRYVRQEVSIQGNQNHQFAKGLIKPGHSPFRLKRIQTTSSADTTLRLSPWTRWLQWYRKVNGSQNSCRLSETKLRQIRRGASMEGGLEAFPWKRAVGVLHSPARRGFKSTCQNSIRGFRSEVEECAKSHRWKTP